jgi:hypothetical protein
MINLPSIVDKLHKKWLEKPIYKSFDLETRLIDEKQWGVFPIKNINQFDCIEYARGLQLGHKSKYHNDPVILERAKPYVCYCQDCQIHGNSLFLPAGNMINYRYMINPNNANADSFFIHDKNLFIVYALKPIKKDEEILLLYKNKQNIESNNLIATATKTA